jgi:hypothetical protein
MPREPCANLLEADVARVRTFGTLANGHEDAADDAAIAVPLPPLDAYCFLKHQRCEMLFRALAVCLAPLGRIDGRKTDTMLAK